MDISVNKKKIIEIHINKISPNILQKIIDMKHTVHPDGSGI